MSYPIRYCKVTGDLRAMLADGADADDLPDERTVEGSVLFTPLIDGPVLMPAHPDGPVSMLVESVRSFIQGGRVQHRDLQHTMLLALDEHTNPSVLRWRVEFQGLTVDGRDVTFAPFAFEAVPGGVVDLTVVGRVPGVPVGGAPRYVVAAEAAAGRAEAAADRAEAAEGGGGGSAIPAGGWPKTDLATPVQVSLGKADTAVQTTDPRLSDARPPTAHTHPVSGLDATGAATGWVVTRGPDGTAAWLAPAGGGGTPGVVVTGTGGVITAPTTDGGLQVAIGSGASSKGSGSVAIGAGAQVTYGSSVAIGWNSRAFNDAVALGRSALALHNFSSAIGKGATTTKSSQVMLGTASETVTMPGKAELGTGTAQVTLSTRLTGGKAELVVTLPSGAIVPLAIDV